MPALDSTPELTVMQPVTINFHDDEIPVVESSLDQTLDDATQLLLLKWHYQLGHLPFKGLQVMA